MGSEAGPHRREAHTACRTCMDEEAQADWYRGSNGPELLLSCYIFELSS